MNGKRNSGKCSFSDAVKVVVLVGLYFFSIFLVYIFVLITGFHDEGNLIATIITSKSLSPTRVFLVACISQFAGTMIIGNKVARTMALGIIKVQYIKGNNIYLIVASALIGAILWNIITWHYCIPSSSSHAIVGGVMGPFVVKFGFKVLNIHSIAFMIFLPLFMSPFIGYIIGFCMMKFSNFACTRFSVNINKLFKNMHIITLVLINMEQGSNDAQKGLGIILMLMISRYGLSGVELPLSVKFVTALMISGGLILGGYKMIKAIGTKIYKVKPFHSINAQIASLLIIFTASKIGAPISGTQVVNSSIVGVGAAERPNAVGWEYVQNMIIGWFITIPCSFMISSAIYMVLKQILQKL